MGKTAADVLTERLLDRDVDTVFGIPGDGINGIMEALRTRRDRIRFVQVRHEEAAALMTIGYANMPYHDLVGTRTQQDVELDKVFMDACVYNARVMGATHVANVADIEFYPKPDQALAVEIDVDATRIGLRYPVEAPVVGDGGFSMLMAEMLTAVSSTVREMV